MFSTQKLYKTITDTAVFNNWNMYAYIYSRL